MKRAKSSYNKLKIKNNKNKLFGNKNQSINKSDEIEIDKIYPNQLFQSGMLSTNNKNYGISPNDYKSKYLNQLKRKNKFKELWNEKNIKGKNSYALLDAIKVQNNHKINYYNNIIGDFKGIVSKKRVSSAGTFCNIPIRSKEKSTETERISFKENDTKLRLNSLKKSNIRTISSSLLINSDLNIIKKNDSKISIMNITNDKDKEKYNNYHSTTFQNSERLDNIISPINSNNKYNINNISKSQNDKSEKNETENINAFIKNSDSIQENYEKNPEILKLRTEYLIKFSKINELIKKLLQITDCFRVNLRDLYRANINSLIKIFDICNNFFLNEIKIGDNINIEFLSILIINIYNYCLQNSKTQKFFFDELHYLKNENLILKQKLNSLENELNQKNKEINEINKLITKYDLNSKVKIGKKIEFNVGKIKQKFTNQESVYVLTIYKLEEEIKNLTELLKKNKPELINQDKMKEKVRLLDKRYEEEVSRLSNINFEKDLNMKVLLQRISSLNEKINELENEIVQLKDNEEKNQENKIYLNVKIENLNKIINKNNEEIDSLKRYIEKNKNINNKKNISIRKSNIIFMSPK